MFQLKSFESMLHRFIRKASESTGERYDTLTLLEQIALAQHHGIPTPILDWSYSPYVAAYFAVTDSSFFRDRDLGFSIYALEVGQFDEPRLSELEETEMLKGLGRPFWFLDTKRFLSRRIVRQAGCFTFQNFPGCLQEWLRSSGSEPSVSIKKYAVSGSRFQMLRELELMGITGGTLFDDLDYISKDTVHAEMMIAREERDKKHASI
jgi:hypothetical protein